MSQTFQLDSLLHSGYQEPLTRHWQEEGTQVKAEDLMFPIFIHEKSGKEAIGSLPGQYRYGIDCLEVEFEPLVKKGLKSVLLFGVPGDNTIKVSEKSH